MVGFKSSRSASEDEGVVFCFLIVFVLKVEEGEKKSKGLLKALEPSRWENRQNNRRCSTIEEK